MPPKKQRESSPRPAEVRALKVECRRSFTLHAGLEHLNQKRKQQEMLSNLDDLYQNFRRKSSDVTQVNQTIAKNMQEAHVFNELCLENKSQDEIDKQVDVLILEVKEAVEKSRVAREKAAKSTEELWKLIKECPGSSGST
jgi:hypothetical protein